MAKGSFPSMSVANIIESFSVWKVVVTAEQLHRPTPDFVENLYVACLEQVTKINYDALRQPAETILNQPQLFHDKELHSASLPNHLLLFHLNRLAMAARVEDFSAKDIQSPERERTIHLLSAFINFVKFTEQFCEPFVVKLRDRSEQIVAERDRVTRRLAEVTEEISEDEPTCEELRQENLSIKGQLLTTKEYQKAAVAQLETFKGEKVALIERKEILNGEVASISEALARTRSRIDKNTIAMHEAKTRDLQAKINALSNIEKDVRGCIEQLQTVEKEVRLLRESQKELHELKDLLDDKHIERKELQQRRERVSKQLSNAQEKLERAQKHAEDRKVASQKTIQRLQEEYDEMVVERRDNDRAVEALRGEADELESKMTEHLKANEAELNQLLAEYWRLRHDTDVYMETLANKLNLTVDSK
ncbi:Nuf2 family-domain-containing protein [Roridomyces roridus]|uniref:Nuf2 family-domain-containing protein n=1 Tax=Roridomyces roridus TaxID=1738132 RepID=A0AAD7FYU0_9AGAR|nr:Nuf2 family-domain-containing protein [Roridomyces roridus]